jgi:hypothetical protein
MDLLAANLTTGDQFHIECSVTHCERWCPLPPVLENEWQKKFLGVVKEKPGPNTDSAKGKSYGAAIKETYRRVGMDYDKIKFIWVCWTVQESTDLQSYVSIFHQLHGKRVEVLSFRDKILPDLTKAVSTANYDDEVLRTFSLIKQWDKQTKRIKTTKQS